MLVSNVNQSANIYLKKTTETNYVLFLTNSKPWAINSKKILQTVATIWILKIKWSETSNLLTYVFDRYILLLILRIEIKVSA